MGAKSWRRLGIGGFVWLAGLSSLPACAPPSTPERPLPPYTGATTEVFDDQIDPAAVGLTLEPSAPPSTDLKLRERVQTADATIRVRIQTVTEKHEDRGTSYVLGLVRVDTFGGAFPPPESFQVHIGTQGASHGVVNSFESRLVGRTFIATVRQFAHGAAGSDADGAGAAAGGDERDLHFHFYTDDKATAEAVRSAFALESFR